MKNLFKKIIHNTFVQMLGLFLLMVLSITILIDSCDRMIEKSEKETGKSFFQQIGEETKKVKDEFNKGFRDSINLKTDTINATESFRQ